MQELPAGPFLFLLFAVWTAGWIVASVASFYLEGTTLDKIGYALFAGLFMAFLLFAVFMIMIMLYGAVRD